jgi:three-Cys-motif partner protein
VEALAHHKKAGTKIELFYFLAAAWFDRALSGIRDSAIPHRWWGRDDWKALRRRPDLERAQRVCDRMKSDLGYKYASPYEIRGRKQGGRVMYYMIHASDHDEAPYLMTRAYNRAVYPKETGSQLTLFLDEVQAMLPNATKLQR